MFIFPLSLFVFFGPLPLCVLGDLCESLSLSPYIFVFFLSRRRPSAKADAAIHPVNPVYPCLIPPLPFCVFCALLWLSILSILFIHVQFPILPLGAKPLTAKETFGPEPRRARFFQNSPRRRSPRLLPLGRRACIGWTFESTPIAETGSDSSV